MGSAVGRVVNRDAQCFVVSRRRSSDTETAHGVVERLVCLAFIDHALVKPIRPVIKCSVQPTEYEFWWLKAIELLFSRVEMSAKTAAAGGAAAAMEHGTS